MGLYKDCVLPLGVDWVMRGRRFGNLRADVLAPVAGTVLEVGFGSGLNLPFYSSNVNRLYALDPARLGRRLARKRLQRVPFPVEFVELRGTRFDLPDGSMDAVVTTWTLCTIPDVGAALREMQRVLRPGGRYYFLEHGRSPDPKVARCQDMWNPVQKRLAGGCHVNREIDRLIRDAGFRLDRLENFYMEGPRIFTYLYRGEAVRGDPESAEQIQQRSGGRG